ncbi:glycoside hydrolase superfamily [Dactylonectria macrodidyma]|uniref:chitinase n=1 Tax=Dactylonectria macrodidyma TaxID=307937 RepID=A0A9P9F619_9HYPO|nr:glycoside hydrolase superfamily [Dactylonectria macrodidyma]
MRSLLMLGAAALATAASAEPKYVLYYDQWHTSDLPDKATAAGINYVITAFANSSLFTTEPSGVYTPFQPLDEVRALFDDGTKVCMAIGGWGDTAGFGEGAKTSKSRKLFAKNVAATVKRLGYDCVDIDWEYPGGNGADYKTNPNSGKVSEIQTYPKLLSAIKKEIGDLELSIAVPALERDMIAYTAKQVRKINKVVDFVNVMTYDLMNRRDTSTTHHVSLQGTLKAIDTYIARGFDAHKLVGGIPFYAKWFTTKKGVDCTTPTGCPTELLEAADGSDTGFSGAVTFEKGNFVSAPTNLTTSPDGSCGVGSFFKCGEVTCCSQFGFCGNSTAHCGTGCQSGYGRCEGTDVLASFQKALANGKTDTQAGAQWYWDASTSLYWSWDTPDLIKEKITILLNQGIGGFMAWSLGEDGYDWSHLKAMQESIKAFSQTTSYGRHAKTHVGGRVSRF